MRKVYLLVFIYDVYNRIISRLCEDVSVVMPAVNYYKRHGNPDERLKAYFYLGRIYLNNRRYDKAAVAYSLAEKEALRSTDVVQNGILYMNLS